jgi:hypothetical protein
MTEEPPEEIQELVESVRVPRGAGAALSQVTMTRAATNRPLPIGVPRRIAGAGPFLSGGPHMTADARAPSKRSTPTTGWTRPARRDRGGVLLGRGGRGRDRDPRGRAASGALLDPIGHGAVSDENGTLVSELGPGNTFGERGLLRGGRAVTTAEAVTTPGSS